MNTTAEEKRCGRETRRLARVSLPHIINPNCTKTIYQAKAKKEGKLAPEMHKTGRLSRKTADFCKKDCSIPVCMKIAGFPLYIIKNAAHNANDDAPEQVNSIIAEFMACCNA